MTLTQAERHWNAALTSTDRLMEAIDDRDVEAAHAAAQRVLEELESIEV